MQINDDKVQNELLILAHHVEDVQKAIDTMGESDQKVLATSGLADIKESVKRLMGLLPTGMQSDFERLTPDAIASEME